VRLIGCLISYLVNYSLRVVLGTFKGDNHCLKLLSWNLIKGIEGTHRKSYFGYLASMPTFINLLAEYTHEQLCHNYNCFVRLQFLFLAGDAEGTS
jgi:hypothetical protein